jgi:hypothetical protein
MNMTYDDRRQTDINSEVAERFIWVSFEKEGIHCYPAAGTDPKLATGDEYDVSFLASPHRHIFHFRVSIAVFHNDRDIEFIQFKRWLLSLYNGNHSVLALDFKSCEMIADDLYIQINSRYPGRHVIINVSEDNENGCEIVYRDPRQPEKIFYHPV